MPAFAVLAHFMHTACVLHSLHKVYNAFYKLITKCALSVLDADLADLEQQNPCLTSFGAPAVPTPWA